MSSRVLAAIIFTLCASSLWLGEEALDLTRAVAGDSAVVCSFRARTGQPCVGCGGSRAFGEAARGRFVSAAHLNLLGAYAGVVAWLLLVSSGWTLAGGGPAVLTRVLVGLGALLPGVFLARVLSWWQSLPAGSAFGP